MSGAERAAPPKLDSILEPARTIAPVSDTTRARARARASAALASTSHSMAADLKPRLSARGRLTLAIALAFGLGATGGIAAAFLRHDRLRPHDSAIRSPEKTTSQRESAQTTAGTAQASELDLLQRAHLLYAARDFAGALELVAAHERAFPNGWLTEEREAVRALCLAGSGRIAEASAALRAYADRFPHSPFLRTLRNTVAKAQVHPRRRQ